MLAMVRRIKVLGCTKAERSACMPLLRKEVETGIMQLSSAVWTCPRDDNIAFMRTFAASDLTAAIRGGLEEM